MSMNNINPNMFRQAQNVQKRLVELREELKDRVVDGQAGGGLVTAFTNGNGELVKITINKARTQARRHTAPRRDVRAESGGQDPWLLESLATEPGPVEASVLVDQIDEALRGLPDSYAQVLALRLEGHRRGEIAAQLGLSRQTVYRALATLKQRLQQLANDAGPD